MVGMIPCLSRLPAPDLYDLLFLKARIVILCGIGFEIMDLSEALLSPRRKILDWRSLQRDVSRVSP
ncbi:hypothetical protein BDM02DRAFT_2526502 [Thelephora ganbajun]|uniref:Uncharacterized protein n=1 Tax=Thelephora ganbajun TaxID=370292 RepID=A0ACB6ZDG0_THEGA|nr:hypothetical protein BDM02DRAFT_2526502 [Thelephora ganbajun]